MRQALFGHLMKPLMTVVPLDGSIESEAILPWLKTPIRELRIDATLFQVAPSARRADEAKAYLERQRKKLHSERLEVFTALGLGRAAKEILGFAKARKAGLVAMTTHGRGGVARTLLGGVADEILDSAAVPLLLVRPTLRFQVWDRVVIPLDGHPEAEAAIPLARRLAPGAQLDLVQVRRHGDPLPYLDGVRSRIEEEGGKAMPVPREGHPGEEIVRYAGQARAGLICMTTRRRSGVARLLAGSVAEHVFRHAPCPVLIVPP